MPSYPEFNFYRHNFEPILETIKTYFPIDNSEANRDSINEFLIKIENVINENLDKNNSYKGKWGKFKNLLREEFQKPVQETMSTNYPCFSGAIELQKTQYESVVYIKELNFYISLLGPYYTILGIDKSEIILEEIIQGSTNPTEQKYKESYPAVNAITVSPHLEYEESFKLLQKLILDNFINYQYVPFQIGMITIPGISKIERYSKLNLQSSVFGSLFRPDVNFANKERGDFYYGYDDWLKVKPMDHDNIIKIKGEQLKSSIENHDILTLNKVWKYQKTISPSGKMMLGHVLIFDYQIDILDLSNNKTAIVFSKEYKDPILEPYEFKNNEICFNSNEQLKLKILKLTPKDLELMYCFGDELEKENKSKLQRITIIFERYTDF